MRVVGLVIVSSALLFSAQATAQTTQAGPSAVQQQLRNALKPPANSISTAPAVDTGTLDKNAFIKGASSFYDEMDTNHDGVLSQDELAGSYVDAQGKLQPTQLHNLTAPAAAAPASPTSVPAPTGIPPINSDQLLKK